VRHHAGRGHARERGPGSRGRESRGRSIRFADDAAIKRRFADAPEEVRGLLVQGRLQGLWAEQERGGGLFCCHRGSRRRRALKERERERESSEESAFSFRSTSD
jgi:hypothetical protein